MSTFSEIIARVDENKPNSFSEQMKLKWLTSLDGRIAADVFLMDIAQIRELPHWYPDAMDAEPLVDYPYEDLYDAYLEAKIDYANGDFNDYQNCMENFNQLYSDFRLWFCNVYDPVQGCTRDFPSYYITAYGLAVKNGFVGTVEHWLDSLVGPKGDPGKSAYRYALDAGYTGTEAEFGNWLIRNGKTAYEFAKDGGYTGTEAEFAAKMAMEYAPKNHDHAGVYAPDSHDHDGSYAPKNHDHAGVYAPDSHDHDGSYAPKNHDHAGVYAPDNHNHDTSYAPKNHDHNGTYLELAGGTMTGPVTMKGIRLTSGVDYGDTLPTNPVVGQLFFLDEEAADALGV